MPTWFFIQFILIKSKPIPQNLHAITRTKIYKKKNFEILTKNKA
jgi:hypothetical protein